MRSLCKTYVWVWCAALAIGLGTAIRADDADPFALANKATPRTSTSGETDPFDPAHKFDPQKAQR